jgi:Tfp pilus assembly protein PilO
MHTAASLTGTKITKVEPQPIKPEGFYNVTSFNIEMVGTYHDFGKFISYVANFPFIANVDKLAVHEIEKTGTGNTAKKEDKKRYEVGHKKETITATFVLSTYFVKEEERLQEVVL